MPPTRVVADPSIAGMELDPAQRSAWQRLQRIAAELRRAPEPVTHSPARLVTRLLRHHPRALVPVRGLYLWGGVGRGKTLLMDRFYQLLEITAKRRLHYLRFMRQVHEELKTLAEHSDPLALIADRWARRHRLLCLDEFSVNDITDAMLLARLLEGLFERGVTLITTSNQPPDQLYRDGLQRTRFLPAIELLQRHLEVFLLDHGIDYRLQALNGAPLYHWPLGKEAERRMQSAFARLDPDAGTNSGRLRLAGRAVSAKRRGTGVVWFDFAALCDGPRSQNDYIELARLYHSVLVSDIPVLDDECNDPARRLLHLIDEFYDRRVKLIISAAAPIERLYQGQRLRFEFQRAISRLHEMQSHQYLAQAHMP